MNDNVLHVNGNVTLDITYDDLALFCQKYHIKKLALFGSVLGDKFNADSDIDVLVDFDAGYKIGYMLMAEIEIKLAEILGRKIDLKTRWELSRYFRDDVCENARILYAQG